MACVNLHSVYKRKCFVAWKYGRTRHITCFFIPFLFTGYGRSRHIIWFFVSFLFSVILQITFRLLRIYHWLFLYVFHYSKSLAGPFYYNVLRFLTSAVVKSWACTVNKADFLLTYVRLCFSSFSSHSGGHPWDLNILYAVSSWISFYFRPQLPMISTTSFTQNISGNLMEDF